MYIAGDVVFLIQLTGDPEISDESTGCRLVIMANVEKDLGSLYNK